MGRVAGWPGVDLETTIQQAKATVLLGLSGQPGTFTEPVVRALLPNAQHPVVFALSNPTSSCEAQPKDILFWTDGRALVATGSPFAPLTLDGRTHVPGQANNAFIFPGMGLGAIVSDAREITDAMFLAASRAVAASVSAERLRQGALFPPVSELRTVSCTVAQAVVREARDAGLGRGLRDEQIEPAVDSMMWYPDYVPYVPA